MVRLGNMLEDNWYMCRSPIVVRTVGELSDRVCDVLSRGYRLEDSCGRPVSVRIGGQGVLVVESCVGGGGDEAE